MKKSWKTTLFGILTYVALVLKVLAAPSIVEGITELGMGDAAAVTAGTGLIAAKDNE